MRIIIIGGGPAAVEAALTARQFNGNANITIFSAENILPYRRPLLVDFLGSEVTPARFFIHEQSFYDQHRIEIRLNTPVISIDWPENRIMLGNQTYEYYDKLLIACGAMASRLPASLFGEQAEGFVLHNWSDAVILKQKLKKSTHIMIVGGGILGLEIAIQCLQQRIAVTLIERSKRILPGVLDSSCEYFLQKSLLEHYPDFQICTNCTIRQIQKHHRRVSCTVQSGAQTRRLEADCIIQTIGFSAGSPQWQPPIKKDRLEVDEFMQVKGFDNIFAAGDCAVFSQVRAGSYSNALQMGRVAGANLAGKKVPWQVPLQEIRSSIGSCRIYAAGNISGSELTAVEEINADSMQKLYYFKDKLVGIVLLGNTAAAGSFALQLGTEFKPQQIPPECVTSRG